MFDPVILMTAIPHKRSSHFPGPKGERARVREKSCPTGQELMGLAVSSVHTILRNN
jgi:hypothetical protein